MNKIYKSIALASLLLGAAAAYGETVTLKKGTPVILVFDQAFNSRTAKSGDKIKMHVAENVKVDGKTAIAQGAAVVGVISEVTKRDHFGRNAKIKLTFNPVRAVSGKLVAIQPRQQGKEFKGSKTDQAALASGGGALILGPVGLLGGYFVTGKSVYIKVGDKVASEVSGDTRIR